MSRLIEIRKHYYYKVDYLGVQNEQNKQVVIKNVTLDNYEDVCVFNDNLASVFKSFLERKYIGLYGYINGKLVSYAWGILNKKNKKQLVRGFFKLPPNSGYVFYCRVFDAFQGNKIYQTMLCKMYQRLSTEIDRIYIDTDTNNMPAHYAILKSNGVLVGRLIRFVVLGRTLFTLKFVE